MPVRKLCLSIALIASAGSGQAFANDTASQNPALPFTVWNAALNVDKPEWNSPVGGVIGAVVDPPVMASATMTLDLKKLSLSDFGDVDSAR